PGAGRLPRLPGRRARFPGRGWAESCPSLEVRKRSRGRFRRRVPRPPVSRPRSRRAGRAGGRPPFRGAERRRGRVVDGSFDPAGPSVAGDGTRQDVELRRPAALEVEEEARPQVPLEPEEPREGVLLLAL